VNPGPKSPVVALDGPAAAGKGTIGRMIAKEFGFAHLDTGGLYRAVAARMLAGDQDPADAAAAERAARELEIGDLGRANLRDEEVGRAASVVAAIPGVRAALLAYQRNFAAKPPGGAEGAVLDGRDIGTVVCPDATVKIYVTASAEERARRRIAELKAKGESADPATILADIKARDERDMNRADAPLKPAADAHLLDTTELAIPAAFAKAKAIIARRLGTRPKG
jgi:cytidylate kinase